MTPTSRRSFRWLGPLTLIVVCSMVAAHGQTGAPIGEWRTYGADLSSTRYSPLDQINAKNFNQLEVAFRFKTDSLGPRPEFNYQSTPLMVGGVLYVTAGSRRAVVALDAVTGEMLWMHSLNEGKRGEAAPRQLSGRGLAYWTDGKEARIVYVTPGYQMIALDAKTGDRVPTFGKNGIVDLKLDNDQVIDCGERRNRSARRAGDRQGRDRGRCRTHRRVGAQALQSGARLRARIRCAHRQAAVDFPHRYRVRASSATRRGKTTRGPTRATPACGRR